MKKLVCFAISILVSGLFFQAGSGLARPASQLSQLLSGPQDNKFIPNSPLLGPEVWLSNTGQSGGERYWPQVAYNPIDHEYLVVWHNLWGGGFRDIYASRVSSAGEVLSWFCVATGAGGDNKSRLLPAVAFNSQRREYLVVYMYEASASLYDIRGKVIPWNAPGSNPEKIIASLANRSLWTPRVAYNSTANEYLVAWNAYNTAISFPPGSPDDIGGVRVNYNGDYYPPFSPFFWTSADYPQQVDMVYNPTHNEYLLVYVVDHSATGKNHDINSFEVSSSGALLDPPGIKTIGPNTEDELDPSVTTNGSNDIMVAWQLEKNASNHDILAVKFGWESINAIVAYSVPNADDDTNPDIAYNPAGSWMTAWERVTGSGIAVKGWWNSNNTSLNLDLVDFAFWENQAPAVAFGSGNLLVAYEGDFSTTNRHIYGRLWSPAPLFLPAIRK